MIPDHLIENALWTPWQDACGELGVSVSPEAQALLARFYAQLIETNRVMNLTRITTPEDFLYRHLLDSLTIVPLIETGARVADVGSGAGFPALPLAIVRPDVQVTAIESVGKKCQFIQRVQESLALSNLTCLSERSEALGQQKPWRANMDVVTARAVASLPLLLELCLPLLKVGGRFLAMKGLSYEAELAASANALKLLGGRLQEVRSFSHPRLEASRLLVFEKTKATPALYPRHSGQIKKNPL